MRLKHIEIAGFKSFAKKSTLTFTAPVTAIVGPNGSGKSNVVEAMKFVLGEQSMKSLRGKSGADLIFRGSNQSAKLSRAAVSITFDNSDNVFAFQTGEGRVPVTFEELTFTREVFADGTSKYLMNGTETRLKQMVELLASVNIGTSSHHIINQGEADRILRSNARERREMIEDALGLKIFQFRIKESEAKLAKTAEHLKEIQLLRRELAPHLHFLKKQVEKAERARALKLELEGLWRGYLATEKKMLTEEEGQLKDAITFTEKKQCDLEDALAALPTEEDAIRTDADTRGLEAELVTLRTERGNLERELGKLEGMIEAHRALLVQAPDIQEGATVVTFAGSELEALLVDVNHFLTKMRTTESIDEIKLLIEPLDKRLNLLRHKLNGGTIEKKDREAPRGQAAEKLKDLALDLESVQAKLKKLIANQETLEAKLQAITSSREAEFKSREAAGEKRFALKSDIQRAESELQLLQVTREQLRHRLADFDAEIREAAFMFGPGFIHSLETIEKLPQETLVDLKRQIDRLKIKHEEHSGIGNEVIKEYDETRERDEFLQKEVQDIEVSIANLQTLIIDLKKTLDDRFSNGVQSINKHFAEFFKTMFGGGSAFLSITIEQKRKRKSAEESDEEEMEFDDDADDQSFERGIEIHVSLPEKKVKELTMLSGGERSLVSIALLFAVSQVNPPPFLVLDETDAALDEANSRRYGDMIERLSEYSQLIVVTHNRETMSRASVLYGVTLGADGASKLLSIKFDEAVKVAK